MEWYIWVLLVAGWMSFGFVTAAIDYKSQSQEHHADSLSYEKLFLYLVAGPVGIAVKLASLAQSR